MEKTYTKAEVMQHLRAFAAQLAQRDGQTLPTIQPVEEYIALNVNIDVHNGLCFDRVESAEEMAKYWLEPKPSHIGMGRFHRDDKTFLISKTGGRQDILMVNTTLGQYIVEPYGIRVRQIPLVVGQEFLKLIENNRESLLRSLHYLRWFNKQTIVDQPIQYVMDLINQGAASYNEAEAIELLNPIIEQIKERTYSPKLV